MDSLPAPLCACGCGQRTTLITSTEHACGYVRGAFRTYIWGHNAERGSAPRFWARVDRTGECWLWLGCTGPLGYGRVTFLHKSHAAHRLAWFFTHGPIPAGMYVCHNCPGGDNPTCVNPAHLFLGTHDENLKDAAKKGMMSHGSQHHNARISEADVLAIRAQHAQGIIDYDALVQSLGVHKRTIRDVVHHKTWKHV